MGDEQTGDRGGTFLKTLQGAERAFLAGRRRKQADVESAVAIFLEFLSGFEPFDVPDPCVTVFGSSRILEGHPHYRMARDPGNALAKAGYSVITGGGPGPMEAANRGAKRVVDLRKLLAQGAASAAGKERAEDFPDWPLHPIAIAFRAASQRLLLCPLHAAFCRPFLVEGAAALLDGPILLVANHASHANTVSILRAIPPALRRRIAVAAASDYFYSGRLRGALASLVLNSFAFSRAGRVRASLERCGFLCDEGWSVLIYPEGTRSPDGRILPFRKGIGLLAPGLGVPVVPVSVSGGHDVLPKGAWRPRRAAVTVNFGAPLSVPTDMPPETVARLLQDAAARGLPVSLVADES